VLQHSELTGRVTMTGSSSLSFGEELRRERVIRDISLEEISQSTKISLRLLRALEDSDLRKLPAPTFTRGFIRAYARHLGIDPEEKVNAYLADMAGETPEAPSGKKARPRSRFWRGRRSTAGTIVTVVAAVLLLLGMIASPARRPKPPSQRQFAAPKASPVVLKNVSISNEAPPAIVRETNPAVPAASAESPPSPAPASGISLLLQFDQDSWAKLEADGRTVLNGIVRRGQKRSFQALTGFRISLGNAGGVRISVDGHALDPLGGSGEVIKDVPLPGLRG
jgi:cytoskeleton protein RodZ